MSIISQDGVSALMWAAMEGHTKVVTQLLEAGANTDLQSTEVQILTALYVCSLVPRPSEREKAWYALHAHARNFPTFQDFRGMFGYLSVFYIIESYNSVYDNQ